MKLLSNIAQLQNKKVLIMGLGTKDGGVGAALFCHQHNCQITVTDLQPKSKLASSISELDHLDISFHLGGHQSQDFLNTDIIIRNPGIKRSHPLLALAQSSGVIIESPIGIFSAIYNKSFLGITGTKGKSLTTHLIEHILNCSNIPAVAAGNNCRSPLRFIDSKNRMILELSSWQLSEMGLHNRSPHLACWLNFFPDHQNYYQNLDQYWEDKSQIIKYQRKSDWLIVPWSELRFKNIKTIADKFFFSNHSQPEGAGPGVWVNNFQIEIHADGHIYKLTDWRFLPPSLKIIHHIELVLAAVACSYLAGASPEYIAKALASFKGLPHRFETIYRSDTYTIINDSAATTPTSVIAAIRAINQSPIILITGGGGPKNLDFKPLGEEIENSVSSLIIFNRDQTSQIIKGYLHFTKVELFQVDNMEQAVIEGITRLSNYKKGTLLLSPGCSGAPFFQDLFQRGEQFSKYVHKFAQQLSD